MSTFSQENLTRHKKEQILKSKNKFTEYPKVDLFKEHFEKSHGS